jgi:arylsulfatase A
MVSRNRSKPWLAIVLLVLASSVCDVEADVQERKRPPNVILIVADDLGWGDVGFNGRTEWATPQLDRLAKQGRVFQRCYTAAVVCAPSRAAFLTGKSTIHCGVRRNDDDLPRSESTIAEALRPHGYATALFGKWHHGAPRPGETDYVHPMDQGFDEFFGYTDAVHAWEKFPTMLWNGRQKAPSTGYIDDLIADRAVEFVGRNKQRPFFLYLAFVATHFGIAAPAEEVARHEGRFQEVDSSQPLKATYAAMVTRLDRNVGRVVETLEKLDLAGDTLIFFTSDHGATFESGNLGTSAALDSNRPFRGQKRTLWEGGVRVPALASWPGRIPAGGVDKQPIQLIDLLPTFVAAAGGKIDPSLHVDGINLLESWTAKRGSAVERTLFWEWRSERADQLAAMHGQFKLVITHGGKPELYDVESDPAERRDVAAQFPDLVQQLRDELDAWLKTESPRAASSRSLSSPLNQQPGARPFQHPSGDSKDPR